MLLLLACTEYGLQDHAEDKEEAADTGNSTPPVVDTGSAPVETATPDSATTVLTLPEETAGETDLPDTDQPVEEEPVDCTGVDFGVWQWWGSQPYTEDGGPSDDYGQAWYETGFTMVGWSTIAMPDQNVPTGQDRAYRVDFSLGSVPPDMTLDIASDDGLWLWVNGVEVGHWGGDWQEEGCVNEGSSSPCDIMYYTDPVDVTDLLVAGSNSIAARVSNPIVGSWFEVTASCVQ